MRGREDHCRGPDTREGLMRNTVFLLISSFFIYGVTDVTGDCVDRSVDCDYWSTHEECLITPSYMMCSCSLSCQTPIECNLTTSNDTDCNCRSWAVSGQCSDPTKRAACPTTCDERETLQCPSPPTVENAHPEPYKSAYFFLDTLQFNCNEGYLSTGTNPTLVCNETAHWVIPRVNLLPTCTWIVCNTPPTIAHASWQGTTFDYNSIVVYSCDTGYETTGGSDVRKCDGTRSWAGSNLVCEKVSCGIPPDLDHANVTFTSTSYQDVAVYTCDVGYNSSQPSRSKQCSEYRNWTGPDIECSVVECGTPPAIDRTEVVASDVIYLSVANYTCEIGYHPVGGDSTRDCGEDGLWIGSDLQCEINSCGLPPSVNNTEVTFVTTTYLSTAEYNCSKGYNPIGGETQKLCKENNSWVGLDLECEVVSCGPPVDVQYTDWSAVLHIYQSQASYNCVVGYEKTGGHDVKTCLDTGVWDGDNLQCQIVTCGTPPAMSNADVSNANDTYLSTATYACQPGYNHTGGDVIKSCHQDGAWKGNDIICSPVDCGTPPVSPNSSCTYVSTIFQSTANYTCDKGHNSSKYIWPVTCGEDQQWQGDLPLCEIVDCEDPPSVENANIIPGPTVYQSEATYRCNIGFNLTSGSDKKTCAENGTWLGADPLCQIVSCGAAPDVPKSTSSTTGRTYGSTAAYSCVIGYKVAGGSPSKTCSEFGTWNGDDLNCTIVTCGAAPEVNNAHVIRNGTQVYQSKVTYDCNPGYDADGGNETLTCSEEALWKGSRLRCKERPSVAETIGVITKFEPEVLEAPASVGFGVAACVIMVVILTGVLLLDLTTFYRHLRYMKENLTDFWQSRKPSRSISLPEKSYSTDA